jgi:NTE family protein
MSKNEKTLRIEETGCAVALSGGGARGFVHLGMVQALKEAGINIKAMSGTSIGALVGCLLAKGMPPTDVLKIAKEIKLTDLLSPKISLKGLISLEKFTSTYEKLFSVSNIEQLEIPMAVAATNLSLGEGIVFDTGKIGTLVAASCCVPGIFQPVKIEGDLYVDGGITNNLPAEALTKYQLPVIGLHCNAYPQKAILNSVKTVLEKSSQLSIFQNTRQSMQHCFLVLDPPAMSMFSSFDFSKMQQFYDIGYSFAREQLTHETI